MIQEQIIGTQGDFVINMTGLCMHGLACLFTTISLEQIHRVIGLKPCFYNLIETQN